MRIHEQIAAVFEKTGWTMEELLTKSGLLMDRSQLGRKLSDKAPMRCEEAERLADTLNEHGFPITLVYGGKKKSKRAAA